MNTQDWSPLGCTGCISLQSNSPTPQFKSINSSSSAFFIGQMSYPHMATVKNIALNRHIFVDKVMSLLLNMLSKLLITFLPRSKCLLMSCLQSSSAVILTQKIKSATVQFLHLLAMKWWDGMPWSFFSEWWALSQVFRSPISLSSRGSLVVLHFLP